METYDEKKGYTTSHICSVVKEIACSLSDNEKSWMMKLIDRAKTLQWISMPKRVIKKGKTYTVSVNVVEDVDSDIFDVNKTFDRAIEYAKIQFDRYGTDKVKQVRIYREDETKEYEPHGDD